MKQVMMLFAASLITLSPQVSAEIIKLKFSLAVLLK